ncbi:LysR family transcriptional regulator [Roseovarius sp. TE539]|uniref:LysR family transcriptional regulator n=1 Tax=Roseovarius sp. TE539 TaxID=2249812 RepID=UPI0011BFC6C6|nr:LysR family transcriptional regulator [Roseovarius sp. TE539]
MALRLSLRHLEMLLAIKDTATLADAAAVLRITPSALTHRLREAERRLGVKLFDKEGRTLRPNTAAQILTQFAERMVDGLHHSERVAMASVQGVHHILRLSIGIYNSFHWLPDFLSWFRVQNPEIEIAIETQGAMAPYTLLAKGDVDLVILPGDTLPGTFEAVSLFDDELVAVLPPDHKLAGAAYLLGADFVEERYLTYSLIRQPGFEADRVWTPDNVMPFREDNIGSVDAICELIRAGLGVSILSHWALRPKFADGGLVPVRVTETGLDIPWRAVIRGGLAEDAPERRLARSLETWFLENPPEGFVAPS